MALKSSPWRIPILLIVVFSAIVGFNFGSVELMGETLDNSAKWLVLFGLAVSFMLSSREMGEMSNAELIAFFMPSIGILGYEFSTRFVEFVEPFEPYFSGLMVALVLLAFYALTNENI